MLRFRVLLFTIGILLTMVLPSFGQVIIPMEKEDGVYMIEGKVNGVPMKFIFDTGASDVCISLAEAIFMLKNGYLKETDLKGVSYATLANGSISKDYSIILRELEIGNEFILRNVKASISNSIEAPLLLGQSAIEQLGDIGLSGNRLIVYKKGNFKAEEKSDSKSIREEYFAHECIKKATPLFDAGEYEKAIPFLSEALKYAKSNKTKSIAHFAMADALWQIGKYEDAVNECLLSVTEDPYYEAAAFNLGVYYYETGDYAKAKQFNESFIQKFSGKKTEDPNALLSAFIHLAESNEKLGYKLNAIDAYENSIKVKPTMLAYSRIGDIYYSNKQYDKAIQYYTGIFNIDPNMVDNIEFYTKRGLSYFFLESGNREDNLNNADNDLHKSIDLLGQYEVYEQIFSEDQTMREFSNKLVFYSSIAKVYTGRVLFAKEEYYQCAKWYSIVKTDPLSKDLLDDIDYYCMWSSYKKIGEIDNAKTIVEEGLSLFKEDGYIDLLFAKSLLLDESDPELVTVLSHLIQYENGPHSPKIFDWGTVYNNLAWAYCCQKEYQKALPYSEKSVKLNPSHDYSWETLGEICYYLGQYEKCVDAMTKCLQISEKYPTAFKYRGLSYQALGRNKEAQSDLEKSNGLK